MTNNIIEVRHSSIVINNYNIGDCDKLEKTFSIYEPLSHRVYLKGIYYDQINKNLYVPRGVDIYWLENILDRPVVMNEKSDKYDNIGDVLIKTLPRDDRQTEAIAFTLGMDKYSYNKYKSQKSINLNTGLGKTYCSITTFAYMRIRTIIIASNLSWLEQWKDFLLQYTDVKEKEVFFISGSSSISKLLKKDISNYKFILASHNTIKSYGDTYGWDKVEELFKYMKVGLKIYDECHLNFDNMCMIDFNTNTKLTLYVSATPARSNKEENTIYKYYFRNIPSIDLFDEDNDPRTQYVAIRFNSNPTPRDISACKNKYGLNRIRYIEYLVRKNEFYEVLKTIINIIIKGNKKTLFYIGTNKAIEIIRTWIVNNYPEFIEQIGVYNSLVIENKKDQLNKQIILTTTKSCGAAIDIKGLQVVVLLAEPFKSEVLARQTLGRCRDKDTTYIEVVDNGFFYTKRYYYEKQDIFQKYATKCTEINFDIKNQNKVETNNIINKHQTNQVLIKYREIKAKKNSGLIFYEKIL